VCIPNGLNVYGLCVGDLQFLPMTNTNRRKENA